MALLDGQTNRLIHGAYGVNERNEAALRAFFTPLQQRGLNPRSCTADGNQQTDHVLRLIWPDIVLQRCVVHVQRQGLVWTRRYPKRQAGKILRDLFLALTDIDTDVQRDTWLADLDAWDARFGAEVVAQSNASRPDHDLAKARTMLLNAVPDLFHYLDDRNIPRSTNAIEGYFSRMKQKYRCHNGLTRTKNFCQWYFQLVRK